MNIYLETLCWKELLPKGGGYLSGTKEYPPTHNELQQHVKCCNYQYYVWKQALPANPDVPSPFGHGWLLRDDLLKIQWIENMPAPKSGLDDVQCRKSAWRNMCQCRILGLECTDLCKCSRSCHSETETNGIESEIDDENDGNNEQSKDQMQIQRKKIDRTHILLPRLFFVS